MRNMRKLIAFVFALILSFCAFSSSMPVSAAPVFTKENFDITDEGVRFYGEVAFGSPTDLLFRGDLTSQAEKQRYTALVEQMLDTLIEIDGKISTTIEGSDIDNFNMLKQGQQVEIAFYTYEVIKIAKEMYALTGGAFNPCVYYLVDLWEFSPRFLDNDLAGTVSMPYDRFYGLPDTKYIDAFLSLLDFDKVVLIERDGSFFLRKDCAPVTVDDVVYEQKIDLGAIGKGYAADVLEKIAKQNNIEYGWINMGGSSQKLLKNIESSDGSWPVELENPRVWNTAVSGSLTASYMILKSAPAAITSSGDYQRNYFFENKAYSHIIDPKTGSPYESNIVMASIINNDAAEGDCLTTAILTMGLEKALEFVNGDYFKAKQIQFSLVYFNPKTKILEVITNLPKTDFSMRNQHFRLASKVVEGSIVYVEANKNYVALYVLLGCVPLFALIILWRKGLLTKWFSKGKTTAERLAFVKKSKWFEKGDIALYSAVLILIVALFSVFVFGNSSPPLKKVEIYSGLNLIYTYDFEKKSGQLEDLLWNDKITVKQVDGGIEITLRQDDGHFNVVKISGSSAVMSEADCSKTKECVNNFAPITKAGQVIICAVRLIRIVGVG